MNVCFAASAQSEIDDAFAWYESQLHGLGTRFLDDLDRTIRRIKTFPFSCMEIDHEVRRCLCSRFPYGVIYGVDADSIVILAVAHLHREPRYWIDRMPDK